MNSNFVGQMTVVLTAIIGVAIVATLVSKKAQTPEVIGSFWKGFSGAIGAAVSPVTGGGGGAGFAMPNLQSIMGVSPANF